MDERFAFDVEWRDPRTEVLWKYLLYVFIESGEVEMVECKSRKVFLKRCLVDGTRVLPELLRPGASITILSRQLTILDYADKFTRLHLESKQERTLCIIKPDAVEHFGKIVQDILEAGFIIGELRMCLLTREEAESFYAIHRQQPFFVRLVGFMITSRIVAIELLAAGAVAKWRTLLGPTDPDTARREAPGTIRAMFGTDKTQNACHGSDAQATALQECNFFFAGKAGPKVGRCWGFQSSSLCIVKPHAVLAKDLGRIIEAISELFAITAAETCHFTAATAAQFLEIYQGVVPLSEFSGMMDDLCSGLSVALEVSSRDEGAEAPVEALRQLCGPADPVLAKSVRPKSLRARFGQDRVLNAVFCTDLLEEAARNIVKVFG